MLPGKGRFAAPLECDACDEITLRPTHVHGTYGGRPWVAQVCAACHTRYVTAEPGSAERTRLEFVLGVFRTAMPLLAPRGPQ